METGRGVPLRQESAVEIDRTFLVPPAPWHLSGEAIAHLDGRGIALLVNYTDSPVGPYHETARLGFTALGPKIVKMAVDSPASRRGGRRNWGYPKTLQEIGWRRRGHRVEVRAEGRVLRWKLCAAPIPLRLRGFTVQRLHGEAVRVPVAVSGRVGLAWRGRQLGVVVHDMRLIVSPPAA